MQKLVQTGQEREERQKAEGDHVLALRQTIQILQDKLDGNEGEFFTVLFTLTGQYIWIPELI